jgi:uncharacterized protein YodC (DUF2158 family)
MKTNYTDEQIQAAIDAACRETHAKHHIDIGTNLVLDTKAMPGAWESEAHARRDLLKFALERLPEPTPPVVDGKTPGQACWETWAVIPPVIEHGWNLIQNKEAWEQAASAVLAAFGQPSLEAAIARMEVVPWKELEEVWDNAPIKQNSEDTLANAFTAVRARLIAAARDDSQPAEADPPAWQPAVGDTVRLKSGGPVMVLWCFDRNDPADIWCHWFDGAKSCGESFPAACLKPATTEEQP